MPRNLALVMAAGLVVPMALASSGDVRPRLKATLETETLAAFASVKQALADPITSGGLFVVNSVGTPVVGVIPTDASGSGTAPLSGTLAWSSSVGLNTTGFKGIMGVLPDNSGIVAVYSSGGTTGASLSGNSGVRTFSGDLAEQFASAASTAQPGSVMSIDPAHPGTLVVTGAPYDRRVAGVVSGAKDYKPGITLRGLAEIEGVTLTLSGTVYCLASDVNGPIRAGDLLTSSSIPGHAMRATDLDRARGAILGKAMENLAGSQGQVLMLASLQ